MGTEGTMRLQEPQSGIATGAPIHMSLPPPGPTVLIPDVHYRTIGDTTLMAEIIRPEAPAAAPHPAIISVHGGAWMHGDRTINRNAFLAERGFFTISIDYRLSGQAIFPAQIEDVKAAIRWVRDQAAHYQIDPQRIGIWGHSAGAHLAALAGTSGHLATLGDSNASDMPTSQVQAVATLACPTDFLQMGGWHDAADSPEAQLVGGPVHMRTEMVRMANPITYVRPGAPPFLLIHGDQDDIVPIGQSELLSQALHAAGNDVTFIPVAGAGHNFGADEASWATAQSQILAFFAEHLGL
jgi:acetyl esterase/lipase